MTRTPPRQSDVILYGAPHAAPLDRLLIPDQSRDTWVKKQTIREGLFQREMHQPGPTPGAEDVPMPLPPCRIRR